jgi:hypothetical protein
MPLVSIPQDLQQEENFLRFRFVDSNPDSKSRKIRRGALIDMKDCVVSSYDKNEGKYRDYSWDEFKAKYANQHYKTSDYKSTISYCLLCGKVAEVVLLYKYIGCMIREKYCSSCAEKRIIKL